MVAVSEVYGTSTVKRRRRTNAELTAIDEGLFGILVEEHPATVRGVYYRAVSAGLVDKTENDYKLVGREILKLRRSESVPYSWITDGTRYVLTAGTRSSAGAALMLTARLYRRRVWDTQPVNVMVFSEKDALKGVIRSVTDRWDVELGVLRGYPSETFTWQVARDLDPFKTTYLYQLGDHDPSGVDAWRHFGEKVREFAPDASVVFERVAVTPEQIEDLDLPTRPTKRKDSRAKSFVGGSVEVDAIAPSMLRTIVEDKITQHLDFEAYDQLLKIEAAEKEQLLTIAAQMDTLFLGGDRP